MDLGQIFLTTTSTDAASTGLGIGILLVYLVLFIANYALVIYTIIDVGRHSDNAWASSGQNKSTWQILTILSLFCLGWILSLVYLLAIRPKVVAAEAGGGIPPTAYPPA
jgi:hypothetical protein